MRVVSMAELSFINGWLLSHALHLCRGLESEANYPVSISNVGGLFRILDSVEIIVNPIISDDLLDKYCLHF